MFILYHQSCSDVPFMQAFSHQCNLIPLLWSSYSWPFAVYFTCCNFNRLSTYLFSIASTLSVVKVNASACALSNKMSMTARVVPMPDGKTVTAHFTLKIDPTVKKWSGTTAINLWRFICATVPPHSDHLLYPTPEAEALGFCRSVHEIRAESHQVKVRFEKEYGKNSSRLSIDAMMSLLTSDNPKSGKGPVSLQDQITNYYEERSLSTQTLSRGSLVQSYKASKTNSMADYLRTHHEGARLTPLQPLQVAGMTVRLHPYQREAVEWMSDIEKSPLGMAEHMWGSFAWPSPSPLSSSSPLTTLYYSPISHEILNEPPPISTSRGGFLCEQMGLGKTIETIALILKNSRPSAPLATSPSSSSSLEALSASSSSLTGAASSAAGSSARSSIPSRVYPSLPKGTIVHGGTLVVCNVSLVGQWQSEMKKVLGSTSQLKVHQYHGAKRIKNPEALSKFDVVVTTYSILGSEWGVEEKYAERVLKKQSWVCDGPIDSSGNKCGHLNQPSNFTCSKCKSRPRNDDALLTNLRSSASHRTPAESIFWHRIVLDESHYIKNANANWSKACNDLSAANKWCVTGTPMGNSIADLASQINFAGLNWCSNLRQLQGTLGGTTHTQNAKSVPFSAALMYRFNRAAMRHTLNQKRNGLPLLQMTPRSDRVIKIDFLPQERAAYQAILKDVQAGWQFLVANDAVSRNMMKALAMLATLRGACSPGGRMLASLEGSSGINAASHVSMGMAAAAASAAAGSGGGGGLLSSAPLPALEECPICFEDMESPTKTPCGHHFCHDCIVSNP